MKGNCGIYHDLQDGTTLEVSESRTLDRSECLNAHKQHEKV